MTLAELVDTLPISTFVFLVAVIVAAALVTTANLLPGISIRRRKQLLILIPTVFLAALLVGTAASLYAGQPPAKVAGVFVVELLLWGVVSLLFLHSQMSFFSRVQKLYGTSELDKYPKLKRLRDLMWWFYHITGR